MAAWQQRQAVLLHRAGITDPAAEKGDSKRKNSQNFTKLLISSARLY